MWAAKKVKLFGVVGVSVLGGVFHNIGQIAIAAIIIQDVRLAYSYTPILIVAGVITGVIIGFTAGFTLNNLKVIRRTGGFL
jgi:heptaprenyl diphosphate synthase